MAFIHKNIAVAGRVQGVFYRASAQQTARQLGVTGFVKNEKDGSVYAEAEGTEEALKLFIDWCRKGPPAAQVTTVQVHPGALQNFEGFRIERS